MKTDKEIEDVILEEKAIKNFNLSGNCAQSAFATLQEQFGFESEDILKALTPFPGLALRGEACGAVVGSLMALGLVYGRDDLSNKRGYLVSLSSARKFCSDFENKYGSTSCASILENKMGKKYNLADPQESKNYLSAGGQDVCGKVVAQAVQIASELMKRKLKIKTLKTTT